MRGNRSNATDPFRLGFYHAIVVLLVSVDTNATRIVRNSTRVAKTNF